MNTPKLYVLVRKDLDSTYRAVQGAHAIVEYSLKGDQELYKAWNNSTVVFLGVKNEDALMLWEAKLMDRQKPYACFHEPDLHDQLTAIACIDSGEIFRKLNISA